MLVTNGGVFHVPNLKFKSNIMTEDFGGQIRERLAFPMKHRDIGRD